MSVCAMPGIAQFWDAAEHSWFATADPQRLELGRLPEGWPSSERAKGLKEIATILLILAKPTGPLFAGIVFGHAVHRR